MAAIRQAQEGHAATVQTLLDADAEVDKRRAGREDLQQRRQHDAFGVARQGERESHRCSAWFERLREDQRVLDFAQRTGDRFRQLECTRRGLQAFGGPDE